MKERKVIHIKNGVHSPQVENAFEIYTLSVSDLNEHQHNYLFDFIQASPDDNHLWNTRINDILNRLSDKSEKYKYAPLFFQQVAWPFFYYLRIKRTLQEIHRQCLANKIIIDSRDDKILTYAVQSFCQSHSLEHEVLGLQGLPHSHHFSLMTTIDLPYYNHSSFFVGIFGRILSRRYKNKQKGAYYQDYWNVTANVKEIAMPLKLHALMSIRSVLSRLFGIKKILCPPIKATAYEFYDAWDFSVRNSISSDIESVSDFEQDENHFISTLLENIQQTWTYSRLDKLARALVQHFKKQNIRQIYLHSDLLPSSRLLSYAIHQAGGASVFIPHGLLSESMSPAKNGDHSFGADWYGCWSSASATQFSDDGYNTFLYGHPIFLDLPHKKIKRLEQNPQKWRVLVLVPSFLPAILQSRPDSPWYYCKSIIDSLLTLGVCPKNITLKIHAGQNALYHKITQGVYERVYHINREIKIIETSPQPYHSIFEDKDLTIAGFTTGLIESLVCGVPALNIGVSTSHSKVLENMIPQLPERFTLEDILVTHHYEERWGTFVDNILSVSQKNNYSTHRPRVSSDSFTLDQLKPRTLIYTGHCEIVGGDAKYLFDLIPQLYNRQDYKIITDVNSVFEKRAQWHFCDYSSIQYLDTSPALFALPSKTQLQKIRKIVKKIFFDNIINDFKNARLFYKEFRYHQPEMFWFNNGGYPAKRAGLVAVIVAYLCGIKKNVMTFHNVPEKPTYRHGMILLYNRILRKVLTRVIAVSDNLNTQLQTSWGYTSEKVVTIPLGLADREPFSDDTKEDFKRSLGLSPQTRLALMASNIDEERKGHHVLIEAVSLLQRQNPQADYKVLLVGDGMLKNTIQDKIKQLQLEDRFLLLGHQSDMVIFNEIADFSLIPSIGSEGIPYTIKEAYRSCKPVITTDAGGCAEAVIDMKTGILVPQNSVESLAHAMQILISDPTLCQKMGHQARKFYEDHYSFKDALQKHREVLS